MLDLMGLFFYHEGSERNSGLGMLEKTNLVELSTIDYTTKLFDAAEDFTRSHKKSTLIYYVFLFRSVSRSITFGVFNINQ